MTTRASTALETLVIGLDGACLRVLDPLVDDHLPHLEALMDAGVAGPLESQVPPWTASAWPSLYTGTNPGKHGVFGFLDFDGYDWDVVNASHVSTRTLWEYLDYLGRTSVVVNAPVTYPPAEIEGAMIPGYLAPEDPLCHPSGLLDDVRSAIGEYRVYPRHQGAAPASTDERLAEYQKLIGMRGDAFRYLADRFEPDFGFLQFQHTDTVLHESPDEPDVVRSVYRAVDDQIGSVVEDCDPDTVFVVSDHGLGPYRTRVRINNVLRDDGFVEGIRGGSGMPTWASIRDDQLVDGNDGGQQRRERALSERVLSLGASVGLTSQRIGAFLQRFGLRDRVSRHVPSQFIRAASEQVDFANSVAYVRSHVECGVRINLAGREPAGVVPPGEYEAVREELIESLSRLETPTGERVFDDVSRREKYFHGPEADRSVDVVTVPRNFDYYLTTWLRNDRFADPEQPGWDHKRDGVIVAAGDEIDTEAALGGAHLFDIAPTVLATLGLQYGDHLDGAPLAVVDHPGQRSYPTTQTSPTPIADDAEIAGRLADLGYLD